MTEPASEPPAAATLPPAIEAVGISMKDVTDTLLREGLASFQKSFDTLTSGIAKKMSSLVPTTK